MRLFARHVHAVQPASTHVTFGWDGAERGAIDRFVAAGFESFETIALAVERGQPVVAPHVDPDAAIVPLRDDDRAALIALHVATRDEKHSAASYTRYITERVDGWRALEAAGRGRCFGAKRDGVLVAALGVFAERERGRDGRRIGRFQHVATLPEARRRGLAGTLVAHASRHAFDALDVDTLLILADADDAARRVYASCGYRIRSRHRGLERGSVPAATMRENIAG